MEKQITRQLQQEIEAMIKKCQDKQVDPFGFGLYARAYQYPAWQKVQNEWGTAFANATVNVMPQIEIRSIGVLE